VFTGIILAIGSIAAIERRAGDCRIKINTGKLSMADVALGDSIAVNGVCLTAVELGTHYFCADVSNETLNKTLINTLVVGAPVNLELALTPTTRMGGHIVSGHVDGVGEIVERKADGRSFRFKIKAPDSLAKYIAQKGSICINGISLTVNEVSGATFSINIVPHTLAETTLGTATTGTFVNLEVDMLARYMERLMQGEAAAVEYGGGVTIDLLHKSGFLG